MVRIIVAALVLMGAFMLYQNLGGDRKEPGVVPPSQQRALDKANN